MNYRAQAVIVGILCFLLDVSEASPEGMMAAERKCVRHRLGLVAFLELLAVRNMTDNERAVIRTSLMGAYHTGAGSTPAWYTKALMPVLNKTMAQRREPDSLSHQVNCLIDFQRRIRKVVIIPPANRATMVRHMSIRNPTSSLFPQVP